MAQINAPWLAGLDDDWVQPQVTLDSTAHIPVRRGSPPSISSARTRKTPLGSVSQRKGLSQLSLSDKNARDAFIPIPAAQKNGTIHSIDSVVRYDTIERQPCAAKSESEMEWKKRLVDGELEYGDQTDLFGPSGLENIFQSPAKKSSPTTKSRRTRPQHTEDMPSSPPPWPPSKFKKQQFGGPDCQEAGDAKLSDGDLLDDLLDDDESTAGHSCDPVVETEECAGGTTASAERKASAQTDIGDETFSPVFISKHTTLNGSVGYAALDSETARLIQKSSIMTAQRVVEQKIDPQLASTPAPAPLNLMDDSIPQVEISLPDNLPTGTPPIARLGDFVSVKRGGMSNCGSFKTRPLSPSDPETRMNSSVLRSVESHDFAQDFDAATTAIPAEGNVNVLLESHTPEKLHQSNDARLSTPKSGGSPLKLFGIHDTFTNTKLLRRLSQLEDLDAQAAQQNSRSGTRRYLRDPSGQAGEDPSRLDNFGEADEDGLDFEADLSFPSDALNQSARSLTAGSPEPDALPPGARSPVWFHVERANSPPEVNGMKRKLSDRSTNKSIRSDQVLLKQISTKASIAELGNAGSVRRSPISPIKAPTPKRQRTLHALDLQMEQLSLLDDNHLLFDGIQDESIPTAVIVGEDLGSSPAKPYFRPSNPTPSQSRYSQYENTMSDVAEESPRLQAIRDRIEESSLPGSVKLVSQAKAVASEVAAFTLDVTKPDDMGERKRSITTQDFLNEAMHIMSLIRARGRPQSGLGSVEESNEETHAALDEQSDNNEREPSVLRVSRPPSRDGHSTAWRPRSQPHHDQQVVDQLKRYEENEDMAILDATLHSLKLRGLAEKEPLDGSLEQSAEIRVSGPSEHASQASEDDVAELPAINSLDSNSSAGYSTGRTQGTTSTRKSDNVATLAPETVAHLIPDQVAGMTFDRTQGKWVRMKQDKSRPAELHSPTPASNITSDDDPFGNIPDLTVDEMRESANNRFSQASNQTAVHRRSEPLTGHMRYSSQDESTFARLDTGYGLSHAALRSSTVPGRSHVGYSHNDVETRATSYATDHAYGKHKSTDQAHGNEEHNDSDVEDLPRNQPRGSTNRHVSFHNQAFHQKRYGHDVEQSEMSIIAEMPDRRIMSVSVSVSRSVPPTGASKKLVHPLAAGLDTSDLILSDLPDFTVAELDKEPGLTEGYLAASVAQHGLEVTGDRYALAVQDMVKALTDAKGNEPFWEDIRQLALRSQNIQTLHGLSDFCVRLQQLDVSENNISHLQGAPASIRWLDASRNALSGLASWHHLHNLQVLDISHNQITSLDALSCLIHLRDLKATHNHISSLDGIAQIEGLIKLDLSHNDLHSADLSHTQWNDLEHLNLSANGLRSITNIGSSSSLETLSLDDNSLDELKFKDDTNRHSLLCNLSVARNDLRCLDLTMTRNLRSIDLDGNRIYQILGLPSLRQLDVLSIREQKRSSTQASSIWDLVFATPLHARVVCISANPLPEHPESLAIQNTISSLEMASCGLLSLPADFGLHFPNLQHLNLNHNALKDIRPVLNIDQLQSLSVAGNRLTRLRKCVETLSHLEGLQSVDMRNNPLTLGFYPAKSAETPAEQLVVGTLTKTSNDRFWTREPRLTLTQLRQKTAAQYLLPDLSASADEIHQKLLDQDTKLRRRVFEILLLSSCRHLETLDSIRFDRDRVLQKDHAWLRLKQLGVLKPSRHA